LRVQTFRAVKTDLGEVYRAPNRAAAEAAIEVFAGKYTRQVRPGGRMPGQGSRRAAGLLRLPCRALGPSAQDQSHRERVRDRAAQNGATNGALSPTTAKLMVFKPVIAASKTWWRLKGTNQLSKLTAGVRFNDGIEVIHVSASHAA
jgi:putative transposase